MGLGRNAGNRAAARVSAHSCCVRSTAAVRPGTDGLWTVALHQPGLDPLLQSAAGQSDPTDRRIQQDPVCLPRRRIRARRRQFPRLLRRMHRQRLFPVVREYWDHPLDLLVDISPVQRRKQCWIL